MKFIELPLKGAYIVEPELLEDERGFFSRTFCVSEFITHGLNPCTVQCSISFNRRKGTLRGMHYQVAPYEEVKLVRCTMGAAYDVILDLRKASPTFLKWVSVELSAENRRMVYIPEQFAHGFQTLQDESEIFYQISQFYEPKCSRGYRWDDEAFGIEWPLADRIISEKDRSYGDFKESDL